jgi:hypothetical protein
VSPVQYALWSAFGLFWVFEAVAHFVLKNVGAHTISFDARFWAHRLTGRYAHFVLAVPALLLFLDFEGLL